MRYLRPPASPPPRSPAVLAGVCLAFVGLVVSGALLQVHLTDGAQGCNLGSAGCGQVALSRYGYVMGLPVPVLTLPFYLAMLLALVMHGFGSPDWRGAIARALRLAAVGALLPSFALLAVSMFVLHRFCPLCLVLDAVNIGLVVATWRLPQDHVSDGASGASGRWLASVGGCAAIAFCVTFALWARPAGSRVAPGQGREHRGMPVRIDQTPPLVAVVDLACIACGETWQRLRQVVPRLAKAGSPLAVEVALHMPDGECLTAMGLEGVEGLPSDNLRCRAAAWAYCAHLQDGLAAFLDQHYERLRARGSLDGLTEQVLAEMARAAALDLPRMLECTGDTSGLFELDYVNRLALEGLTHHVKLRAEDYRQASFTVPQLHLSGQFVDPAGVRSPQGLEERLQAAYPR